MGGIIWRVGGMGAEGRGSREGDFLGFFFSRRFKVVGGRIVGWAWNVKGGVGGSRVKSSRAVRESRMRELMESLMDTGAKGGKTGRGAARGA